MPTGKRPYTATKRQKAPLGGVRACLPPKVWINTFKVAGQSCALPEGSVRWAISRLQNLRKMHWKTKIKNVLRGMRQRWGDEEVKRKLWDLEYGEGRWDHCERTPGAAVYAVVEECCAQGSVLDLGCGAGNTGNELDENRYADYTGVDISEVAIAKAAARSRQAGRGNKNRYIQSDIISYLPRKKHDVILLRESIYYIPQVENQISVRPLCQSFERSRRFCGRRGRK